MRGTTTITWLLLLSLSYQVCSVDGQDASVTKNDTVTSGDVNGTAPTPDSTAASSSGAGTGPQPTSDNNNLLTLPSTSMAAPAAATDIATPKSINPTPNQPQATTVTNNPPALPTSNSGTVAGGVTDATAPPNPLTDSSLTSKPTATDAPAATPPSATGTTSNPSNFGIVTNMPSVLTAVPGRQSTATTIPVTSQGGSNAGTGVVTIATGTPTPQNSAGTTAAATSNPNDPITTYHQTTIITNQPTSVANTGPPPAITTVITTTITIAPPKPQTFKFSLNNGQEKEEEKELVELCKRLMANLANGNCTLTWRHHNGKVQFDCVEINGKVKTSLATQYYEEITKKPTDSKTMIAILSSCGALLIMIVILAMCASHHRKPYHENQQHLTEELHTVENGYHDNPTLEVMEVQPEMQEKKMALNGEFNDSWIVPIDNLMKEDPPEEEDTHL